MKKVLSILAIGLCFSATVKAQISPTWPVGPMTSTAYTITTLTTTMTPLSIVNTVTYAFLTVDTSLVLRATINRSIKAGAILYVKIKNNTDAATHAVTGSTGITMVSYTLTSAKNHVLTFFYDGTNFIQTGVIKID